MICEMPSPVLKTCLVCGEKINLAERWKRERQLANENRSRHECCDRCQNRKLPPGTYFNADT